MQDQINNIERIVGRLEEGQDTIKALLEKHDARIGGLEKFKYWLLGIIVTTSTGASAIVTQVKDVLGGGSPHH